MTFGFQYEFGVGSQPDPGPTQATAVQANLGWYDFRAIPLPGALDLTKAVSVAEQNGGSTNQGWYKFTANKSGLIYLHSYSATISVWQGDNMRGARYDNLAVNMQCPVIRGEEYTFRIVSLVEGGTTVPRVIISEIGAAVSSFVYCENIQMYDDQYENSDGSPAPFPNSRAHTIIGQPNGTFNDDKEVYDVYRLPHIQPTNTLYELPLITFDFGPAPIPPEAQPAIDQLGLSGAMADVHIEIFGQDMSWTSAYEGPPGTTDYPVGNEGMKLAFYNAPFTSSSWYGPMGYHYKPEELRTRWISLRNFNNSPGYFPTDIVNGTFPVEGLDRYWWAAIGGQGYRAYTVVQDYLPEIPQTNTEEPEIYEGVTGLRVWWWVNEDKPVVRQHPVDHGFGISSSKRTFPEPNIRRVYGGFE